MFTDYLQTFYYLIYIYTSGFVSLQLVHVSTHKKYRFYQSLTQIKKRSNCFGNPKQKKKSETSTTLWGHWHSRPMGKWWYDLPCKQKRHHLFKKWNRRSRFVSYLNFTVCDICIWCGGNHSVRYELILLSIPLFEEMVSLLLTRKIVSSFTHWPRMPMTSKSTRLRFF